MRSRKKKEIHESPERWIVSYADFITLLFAFFAVLYATSEHNTEKSRQFEQSIKKYLIKLGAFGASGPDANQGEVYNKAIDNPIQTFPDRQRTDHVTKVLNLAQEHLDKTKLKAALTNIEDDDLGVRISLAASQIFEGHTAVLNKAGLTYLNEVAKLLKEVPYKFYIESHSDNQKPTQFTSPWELTAARSSTVIRYLIQVHGLQPKKLIGISYGDQHPMFPNDSAKNRERNQRLDFLIVTEDSPI